jgi:hypothetical protein
MPFKPPNRRLDVGGGVARMTYPPPAMDDRCGKLLPRDAGVEVDHGFAAFDEYTVIPVPLSRAYQVLAAET